MGRLRDILKGVWDVGFQVFFGVVAWAGVSRSGVMVSSILGALIRGGYVVVVAMIRSFY